MPANYVLLETVTVGAAGASSVTFNSIPQSGYTDLEIKLSSRITGAGFANWDAIICYFNADTTYTNYSWLQLYGNGSSAGSETNTANNPFTSNSNTTATTASTFSNGSIYIPNYTVASNKSVSSDSVTENNGTTSLTSFNSVIWNNTAAITSVTLQPRSSNFAQYSTFSLYGIAAVGSTPVIAPKASGGDIIQTDGTYWYHAFLSSGTFTPALGLSCDVLSIGGGGGGGQYSGGGAGGLRFLASQSYSTSQTVTVGAGGNGSPNGTTNGTKGSDSVIGSVTGLGGGIGDAQSAGVLKNGGSGGGGNATAGTGTAGQGNNGGTGGTSFPFAGGGGGGAGAVGGNGSGSVGGNGGAGLNTYSSWASVTGTGVSGYYAGGGGGAAEGTSTSGTGGLGGGGNAGASGANNVGLPGTANTGGGGGGAHYQTAYPAAGAGGSGIVIIRYTIA